MWRGRLAPSDGRDQENAVAFFQRAAFAAKKAYVLLIEIDVEELANLSLFIANMAREIRKAGGQVVQRLGDGCGTTVDLWRAVRKAAERRWNFNGDWHVFCFSLLRAGSGRSGVKLVIEVSLECI